VCGGRGICGRCQVEVAEGEHAKHGIASSATHLTPAETSRARTPPTAGSRGPPARLHARASRRPRRRRATREPALPPGRAQGGRRAPDRVDPSSASTTSSRGARARRVHRRRSAC
jgi:hypothetical protein